MGKGNKHVLKPPKIKNKSYYTPTKDETFVVIINPPREELPDGRVVLNVKHIQTWLSAIAQRPNGVANEMYVIKTHEEPIVRLENVDLKAMPILGLHRWREFIRDLTPKSPLWNEQTVIAEYDVKRFNHPKNIQYQIIDLADPDLNMYAGVIQPYPHPHPVDLSRNDLGLRVSSRAMQIVDSQSLLRIPSGPDRQNGDAPKAEQDPRITQDFDGIDQDVKAYIKSEARAADLRPNQVFDDIDQDIKFALKIEAREDARRDRRGEVQFDGIDDTIREYEEYERSRATASGQVVPVQVTREATSLKQEDAPVNQEDVPVKQEAVSVKQEGIPPSGDDPRLHQVFDGIEQEVKAFQAANTSVFDSSPAVHSTPQAESIEDVKPFAPRDLNVHSNDSSVRVKEEADTRTFSPSPTGLQPKAGPDAHFAKQEDHTRSTGLSGAGNHGRGTFPPPSGFPRIGVAVKRERDVDDIQASKRFKAEY
ncbi:unnamed protein product [Peniophora sp. CBMAI 1063]|nr:unnamed protein product [Peniophora sp. CBMAI 1063]